MARLARVVVPDVPHHVTQRGNRRQATFFNEHDYKAYLRVLGRVLGVLGPALSVVNTESYSSLKGLAIMADYRRYLKRIQENKLLY